MGSETTNYRVKIAYEVADKATRALGDIDKSAQRAAGSVGNLDRLLMGAGAAVLGSRALRSAKSAFIDFNAGIEDSQVLMAGMLQMNVGGEWAANMRTATSTVSDFQQMAKSSALTTKDLVNMAQMIESPLLQAGAGMKKIEDLTFGAANAAKAFQIPAEMAALDIQQAINGTLSSKDRFAKTLLAQKGVGYDSEKFNKLSSKDRLGVLSKALDSDAIKQMAGAQAETLTGVMSTFQDNLQMTAGRIGLPLFKAITKEIKSWNIWIDQNQVKVDAFVSKLSDGLSQAFGYLRSAVGFIIDHADTMIMIAKVWAAAKIGGAIGGGLGGIVGGDAGKLFGQAGTVMALSFLAGVKIRQGIDNFFGNGPKVAELNAEAQAVKAGAGNYSSLATIKDSRSVGYDMLIGGNETKLQMLRDQVAALDTAISVNGGDVRKRAGLNTATDDVFQQQRNAKMEELSRTEENLLYYMNELRQKQTLTLGQSLDVFSIGVDQLAHTTNFARDAFASLAHDLPAVGQALWTTVTTPFINMFGLGDKSKDREMAKPSATNIHIAKIEVPAKDPDRWIAELDARVSKQIKAPKSARRALRGF